MVAAVEGDAARETHGGRCEAGGAPSEARGRNLTEHRTGLGYGEVSGIDLPGREYQMYLLRLNRAV